MKRRSWAMLVVWFSAGCLAVGLLLPEVNETRSASPAMASKKRSAPVPAAEPAGGAAPESAGGEESYESLGSGGFNLPSGSGAGLGSGSLPAGAAESNAEENELDQILAGLSTASIAFNAPEEIPFGDTVMIELLLSMPESESQLAGAITGPGSIETARIKFSNAMTAKLTGLGFRIEPITPEQQAVSRRERTRWQWAIEPVRADVQPLVLTLSARVRVDGETTDRLLQTFEHTIRVRVPITRRVTEFVAGNIEFIATALVAPVAAAVWRRYRRRRKKGIAEEQEPIRRAA